MFSSAPVSLSYGRRANTTSEMYINYTLETPNREQIIHSMAKSIHYAIGVHYEKSGNGSSISDSSIFSERKNPMVLKKRNFNLLPNLEEIVSFVKFWFFKQVLSPQVGIMAIHYIDQLIHKTGLLITPVNWRRVLLCSLMISDKLWEEDIVCNADYCNETFPLLTVEDLNAMERLFLSLLDFKLLLKASVYAEYYFALRSISGLDCFPSRPLNKKSADFLQEKCGSTPKTKRRRSYSVDTTDKKEKPDETSALSYEQVSRRFIGEQSAITV
jgi:hypothetical protein